MFAIATEQRHLAYWSSPQTAGKQRELYGTTIVESDNDCSQFVPQDRTTLRLAVERFQNFFKQ
jgi:hypothetical protein